MRDRLQADGYTPHHDKVDADMIANRLWFRCVCRGRMTYIGLRRPARTGPLPSGAAAPTAASAERRPNTRQRVQDEQIEKEFHP
jgi:hypothetical protein